MFTAINSKLAPIKLSRPCWTRAQVYRERVKKDDGAIPMDEFDGNRQNKYMDAIALLALVALLCLIAIVIILSVPTLRRVIVKAKRRVFGDSEGDSSSSASSIVDESEFDLDRSIGSSHETGDCLNECQGHNSQLEYI